jgi:hypothetical protein
MDFENFNCGVCICATCVYESFLLNSGVYCFFVFGTYLCSDKYTMLNCYYVTECKMRLLLRKEIMDV